NLGASQKDIRAAYRKLAKRCHPDTNASDTAGLEFEKVQCAYEALRSHRPRQRARQASGPSPPSRAKRPLACTSCGRATLSPRYTRTTTVLSFLFASRRISNEAILCHGCARLRVLRANALIGLFGWWSIQGIFLA